MKVRSCFLRSLVSREEVGFILFPIHIPLSSTTFFCYYHCLRVTSQFDFIHSEDEVLSFCIILFPSKQYTVINLSWSLLLLLLKHIKFARQLFWITLNVCFRSATWEIFLFVSAPSFLVTCRWGFVTAGWCRYIIPFTWHLGWLGHGMSGMKFCWPFSLNGFVVIFIGLTYACKLVMLVRSNEQSCVCYPEKQDGILFSVRVCNYPCV